MSRRLCLYHPTGVLRGTVKLPASKSESNRALIIQALSLETITLHNLSNAHDTALLQNLLQSPETEINAEDAGTVMRFLTAYFSFTNQNKNLTGTARMHQRPIGILVDALRELGAEIHYAGQEGFPPLELRGFNARQTGMARLALDGSVSSQFISALLLGAPTLAGGLEITLTGKIASKPYIQMTLALMEAFGVKSEFRENRIMVWPQQYSGGEFWVEADWSAVSYWYSLAALAREAEIRLPGLKENSLQGDRKVAGLMEKFGVKTTWLPKGIVITKTQDAAPEVAIDFTDIPDLAQTFAVLAAAKNVTLEMTGLESLRIKETDRIEALQTELKKIGATFTEIRPGTFLVKKDTVSTNFPGIKTYHDHRMAMAFAPLGLVGKVEIEDPEVVRKSYPGFWEELRKVGFELNEV